MFLFNLFFLLVACFIIALFFALFFSPRLPLLHSHVLKLNILDKLKVFNNVLLLLLCMNSLFLIPPKLNTPTPPKFYSFLFKKNSLILKYYMRKRITNLEIPPWNVKFPLNKKGRSFLILWTKIVLNKLLPFYTNKFPTILLWSMLYNLKTLKLARSLKCT